LEKIIGIYTRWNENYLKTNKNKTKNFVKDR
jgi:hypothetical protein